MQQTELFTEADTLTDRDPRKHCDRLFFALMPNSALAEHIRVVAEAFHQERGLDRVVQPATREHVSIMQVGDYRWRLREKHVYAAELAARRIVMPRVDITFNAIGSFAGSLPRAQQPAHRPLVLRADDEAPRQLCHQLRRALGRRLLPATRQLVPHLTLSYGPEMIAFEPVAPIRFTADEFVLIHSEVGLTRYHLRGRWPLAGGMSGGISGEAGLRAA